MQSIGNGAGGNGVEAALTGDGKGGGDDLLAGESAGGGMGYPLSATYVAQRVLLL